MCYTAPLNKLLDIKDAAYIAAFIDGEGTIGLWRRVKPETGHLSYRPMVEVCNTNKEVLGWFAEIIGNGWFNQTNKKNVAESNHKPLYRFRFRTQDLRWVLPQIRPYLKIKGRQADLLTEYFELVKNTRPNPKYTQSGKFDAFWSEIKQLNHRGVLK